MFEIILVISLSWFRIRIRQILWNRIRIQSIRLHITDRNKDRLSIGAKELIDIQKTNRKSACCYWWINIKEVPNPTKTNADPWSTYNTATEFIIFIINKSFKPLFHFFQSYLRRIKQRFLNDSKTKAIWSVILYWYGFFNTHVE